MAGKRRRYAVPGRPFKKANPGGPGRPKGLKTFETDFRKAFRACCNPGDIEKIIKALRDGAAEGRKDHLRLFCEYWFIASDIDETKERADLRFEIPFSDGQSLTVTTTTSTPAEPTQ